MDTFRSLILAASTIPQGAALRVHLKNLNGGSGSVIIIGGELTADIDSSLESSVDEVLVANIDKDNQATLGGDAVGDITEELEATICQV